MPWHKALAAERNTKLAAPTVPAPLWATNLKASGSLKEQNPFAPSLIAQTIGLAPHCRRIFTGRGGGIRTPYPLLPKQVKRFIEAY